MKAEQRNQTQWTGYINFTSA